MADIVSIDKDKIMYSMELANGLAVTTNDVQERLKKSYTQLNIHMQIMKKGVSMHGGDGMVCSASVRFDLEAISRKLQRQSDNMQRIATVIGKAQAQAESASNKLEQDVDKLAFKVGAFQVFVSKAVAAISSVVSCILGVGRDSIGHTDVNNPANTEQPSKGTGSEAQQTPQETNKKLSEPDWSNDAYYGSGNLLTARFKYYCTWYVWGRTKELLGIKLPDRIKDFVNCSVTGDYTDTPSTNSIAVYRNINGDIMHVAYIESFDGTNVTYSEGNNTWKGTGVQNYFTETITLDEFKRQTIDSVSKDQELPCTQLNYIPLE